MTKAGIFNFNHIVKNISKENYQKSKRGINFIINAFGVIKRLSNISSD